MQILNPGICTGFFGVYCLVTERRGISSSIRAENLQVSLPQYLEKIILEKNYTVSDFSEKQLVALVDYAFPEYIFHVVNPSNSVEMNQNLNDYTVFALDNIYKEEYETIEAYENSVNSHIARQCKLLQEQFKQNKTDNNNAESQMLEKEHIQENTPYIISNNSKVEIKNCRKDDVLQFFKDNSIQILLIKYRMVILRLRIPM